MDPLRSPLLTDLYQLTMLHTYYRQRMEATAVFELFVRKLPEGRRFLVMRLADFGVRTYSLNMIVNDQAWADPARRDTAMKILDAVNEGYSLVNERPGDAANHFQRLFPRLAPNYIVRSMVSVSDRKSTRLNSSHMSESRMPSSA